MKKILFVALMTLVMGVFAGCKSGINGSDWYRTHQLNIDYNKCTVNGTKYDNTVEKCWAWTATSRTAGRKAEVTQYLWCTEFVLVATCETFLYECYQASVVTEYAYIEHPSSKDPDACEANNNDLY
jgi:hypothetical protein